MISYSTIKRERLGRTCRRCINSLYQLKLEPADCIYLPYPHTCMECNQQRNIIEDIVLFKRYKLLSGSETTEE